MTVGPHLAGITRASTPQKKCPYWCNTYTEAGTKGQFFVPNIRVTNSVMWTQCVWRACVPSLTVVVREGQQGEFLQPLRQLIVRPRMLSGPVRDEDQGPGKGTQQRQEIRGTSKHLHVVAKRQYSGVVLRYLRVKRNRNEGAIGLQPNTGVFFAFFVVVAQRNRGIYQLFYWERRSWNNICSHGTFSFTLPVLISQALQTARRLRGRGPSIREVMIHSWVFSREPRRWDSFPPACWFFIRANCPQTHCRPKRRKRGGASRSHWCFNLSEGGVGRHP